MWVSDAGAAIRARQAVRRYDLGSTRTSDLAGSRPPLIITGIGDFDAPRGPEYIGVQAAHNNTAQIGSVALYTGRSYSVAMSTLTRMGRYAGTYELANLLGVSRGRIAVLTSRPAFPAPVISLVMGKVWDIEQVTAWAASSNRTLHLDTLPPDEGHRVPQRPVGASEILAMLGVSQTRLMEFIHRRTDFPAPVLTIKRGSVWDRDDITAWAHAAGRTLTGA